MEYLISRCGCFVLPLGIVLLASCVRAPVGIPEVGGQIGEGYGQMIVPEQQGQLLHASHGHQPTASSTIEGQLQDGGWVMNVPGQAHTHKVVLSECPETPVVARHVHNHMLGAAWQRAA